MTFGAPGFLWALPLAAAPFLFHLLSRRNAARVPFSDLSLLKRLHARALPRARLRERLLAAARSLIVLFLILAFARPVLRATPSEEAAAGAGAQGLDLVLLLDGSYSMGYLERGKPRFDLARRVGEDLVRGLRSSDRVAVGLFSDRLESGKLAWQAPAEALAALAKARLGWRTTDYGTALKAAGELLAAEPKRRRAALVLSDGARHGLRGARPALDPGILWLGLKWPAARNSFVSAAAPAAASTAMKPRLAARAVSRGAGDLTLTLDGRRAQSAALKGTGLEETATLALPTPRDAARPAWSGSVALRADALPADDAYFFSVLHPARPKILCLYGNPAFFKAPNAGYFLRELLGAGKDSLLDYDADFAELSRLSSLRLTDYRAVVLADFRSVGPGPAGELERFVRRGGGLWLLPGAATAADGFDALDPWLPARLGALVQGEGPGLKPAKTAAGADWKAFDLAKVSFARYYLLAPRAAAAVPFKSAAGYPLVVTGRHGDGRTAVWASALDPSWSNLALKPVFAAIVQSALDAVCGSAARRTEILDTAVGEPLTRTWPLDEPAPASVRVRAPDGRSSTLWLKNRSVSYSGADAPGLYTMTEDGGGRVYTYAVNADRRSAESDLEAAEDPPWRPIDADAALADFRLEVYGKDGGGAALASAASLLLLEMLLALPRRAAVVALALLAPAFFPRAARAQQGDRFIWSQVRLGPDWDPYPGVPAEIAENLSTLTSVLSSPQPRALTFKDKALWSSPLVVLAGRQSPPALDEEERRNLRDFLLAGGVLWIEDASGEPSSSMDRWVRKTLPQVLPESELAPLPPDHVLYKTFFLLRGPAGRVMTRESLEGVSWSGRTAVIYSREDILGAWAKDALGKPLYSCVPGGEAQRTRAKRLTLNIIMYSLTGSYKADAVHQPYLLQKMRSGIP